MQTKTNSFSYLGAAASVEPALNNFGFRGGFGMLHFPYLLLNFLIIRNYKIGKEEEKY